MSKKIPVDDIKLTFQQQALRKKHNLALEQYKAAFDHVSDFCAQGWTYHTHPGAMNCVYKALHWVQNGKNPEKRPDWMNDIIVEGGVHFYNLTQIEQQLVASGLSYIAIAEWARRVLDKDVVGSKEILVAV